MAELYYYIPADETEYVLECGLKLSKWYDKEVVINGVKRKCLTALLNPKDDMEKYKDTSLCCVKLDVPSQYCYVADRYLYEAGLDMPEAMQIYINTIIPIEKYLFGFHRLPECLVTTTVIAGQVKVLNRAQDSPVLIRDSEELYLNNLLEANIEKYENFKDEALYYFYSKLEEMNKVDKIEDKNRKVAIFTDKAEGKIIIVKIPE